MITKTFKLLALVSLFCLVALFSQTALAWDQPPAGTPPACDPNVTQGCNPPINTGSVDQIKKGGLTIKGIATTSGALMVNNNSYFNYNTYLNNAKGIIFNSQGKSGASQTLYGIIYASSTDLGINGVGTAPNRLVKVRDNLVALGSITSQRFCLGTDTPANCLTKWPTAGVSGDSYWTKVTDQNEIIYPNAIGVAGATDPNNTLVGRAVDIAIGTNLTGIKADTAGSQSLSLVTNGVNRLTIASNGALSVPESKQLNLGTGVITGWNNLGYLEIKGIASTTVNTNLNVRIRDYLTTSYICSVGGICKKTEDIVNNLDGLWTKITGTTNINYSAGNVGIGSIVALNGTTNNNPGLKLEVSGSNGFPATSGTAQTGSLRISSDVSHAVLDMGVGNLNVGATDPKAGWLQVSNKSSLNAIHPLFLNPNGGTVKVPSQGINAFAVGMSGNPGEEEGMFTAKTTQPGIWAASITSANANAKGLRVYNHGGGVIENTALDVVLSTIGSVLKVDGKGNTIAPSIFSNSLTLSGVAPTDPANTKNALYAVTVGATGETIVPGNPGVTYASCREFSSANSSGFYDLYDTIPECVADYPGVVVIGATPETTVPGTPGTAKLFFDGKPIGDSAWTANGDDIQNSNAGNVFIGGATMQVSRDKVSIPSSQNNSLVVGMPGNFGTDEVGVFTTKTVQPGIWAASITSANANAKGLRVYNNGGASENTAFDVALPWGSALKVDGRGAVTIPNWLFAGKAMIAGLDFDNNSIYFDGGWGARINSPAIGNGQSLRFYEGSPNTRERYGMMLENDPVNTGKSRLLVDKICNHDGSKCINIEDISGTTGQTPPPPPPVVTGAPYMVINGYSSKTVQYVDLANRDVGYSITVYNSIAQCKVQRNDLTGTDQVIQVLGSGDIVVNGHPDSTNYGAEFYFPKLWKPIGTATVLGTAEDTITLSCPGYAPQTMYVRVKPAITSLDLELANNDRIPHAAWTATPTGYASGRQGNCTVVFSQVGATTNGAAYIKPAQTKTGGMIGDVEVSTKGALCPINDWKEQYCRIRATLTCELNGLTVTSTKDSENTY